MDAHLQHLLLERLAEANDLSDDVADVVLAACEGEAELQSALAGEAAPRSVDDVQPDLVADPPGAYLASIAVEGFRGIGHPRAELQIAPGPGLTIVMGRNGSGKSSFAEGLELAMTGANSRWTNRTSVWTQGWQNLHHEGDTVVQAQLHVDGQPGVMTLKRKWPHGAHLDPGTCSVTAGDGSTTTLDELGWATALSRFRPFLSYNELGQMFDELKTMYDALAAILGLEDVEDLHKTLREARLERERAIKHVRTDAKALADELGGVEDERVAVVVGALTRKPLDLDAIELVLEGVAEDRDPASELAVLRALASLPTAEADNVAAACEQVHACEEQLDVLATTHAARAASLADLLDAALEHDAAHHELDCPVCGSGGRIDEAWRHRSQEAVARLRDDARAVREAVAELASAQRAMADLLPPTPPPAVAAAPTVGLEASMLQESWDAWADARRRLTGTNGGAAAAAAAAEAADAVARAAEGLRAAAGAEIDRREDLWRPIARRLIDWLPAAREGVVAASRLHAVRAAEAWVKETAVDLQAQRLAPVADAARRNWEQLRQESNVSLEGFYLRKSGATRAAHVDVRVDGSDASAFGVMSQGELHALAVSVFLPRAGLPESPFRFMVIDDPVQSMDPAKVDGLARVLEQTAAYRQVVVFTHDERLFEAVRRLHIDATVLEVTRRPRSVVEIRTALDPIERSVDDARALLREDGLSADIARRVVPGFCRHALEAAAAQAVRRRRLARGERHADIDALLDDAHRLNVKLSLALFDDPGRGGDVLTSVNNRWGKQRGDVVVGCNKGVHELLAGDLRAFVTQAAVLARDVAQLA